MLHNIPDSMFRAILFQTEKTIRERLHRCENVYPTWPKMAVPIKLSRKGRSSWKAIVPSVLPLFDVSATA